MSGTKNSRAVVTGVLLAISSLDLAAAQFSGRVTDREGSPVPSTVIALCNANADLWFLTSTDATGAFEFPDLPANTFNVEVLSPEWRRSGGQIFRFGPWTDSIVLRPGQSLQRDIGLGAWTSKLMGSQSVHPCSPQRPYPSMGEDRLAGLLLRQTPPVLPQILKNRKLELPVVLDAFMNKDGRVISLRLLASAWPPTVDPLLTRAAVEAVRDWRFTPAVNTQTEVFEFGGQISVDFEPGR